MEITTIIFDLGDVYIRGFKGFEPSLVPILKLDSEIIRAKLREHGILTDLFHGKITEEEYWSSVIHKNGWKVDINTLKKIVRDNFKEIEGTRHIIESLKKKRYKLGLLSVHTKEWIDFCEHKYDYHKLFHSRLYSFEVGMSKPDSRIYPIILERLNAKPSECVFIDDKETFLVPAREIGIKTILFKDSSDLKRQLKKLKIKI